MGPIGTVSVLGVGLIGGSFALALRRMGFAGRILGVSSDATLTRALEAGVIDEGCSISDAVPRSDLVYMSQPVLRIIEQLPDVRRLAPEHALVTDAGSTKKLILDRARELFDGGPDFLGGHPMAGSEGRGVDHAEARLFEGAVYALVPTGASPPESGAAREFLGWLGAMGCRTKVIGAAEHDRTVAWTSHMAQLVSTALAAAIGSRLRASGGLEVAGDGLRDMTRLAASPHAVWSEILDTNRDPIDEALDCFVREVEALRRSIREDGAASHFERGNALRARLEATGWPRRPGQQAENPSGRDSAGEAPTAPLS